MAYSKAELKKLSSTRGILSLLSSDTPDFNLTMKELRYAQELDVLQTRLIKMQNWVVENDKRLIVIFEGGEFSGKGSAISAFSEHLNPRSARIVALPKPTETEAGQWYFQRYATRLPKAGEIVFFDRSWYNRAVVEPVNGFCTKEQYEQFMEVVNHFEKMILQDGTLLIKIFLAVSKKVQASRINRIRNNPLRRWEFTDVDKNALKLRPKYEQYEKKMFETTSTKDVPWKIINSSNQFKANLAAIRYVLSEVPFANE